MRDTFDVYYGEPTFSRVPCKCKCKDKLRCLHSCCKLVDFNVTLGIESTAYHYSLVECTHRDGSVQDHVLVLKGEVDVERKSRSKSRNKSTGARVQKEKASVPKETKQSSPKTKKLAADEDLSYEDVAPRKKKSKKP